MSNSNVRQALAYLVDREQLVDRAVQGVATPLYSQVPPGFIGANEAFLDRYHAPDVEVAEELLRAEGYSEGSPLTFDLWYPSAHYGGHSDLILNVLEEQFERTPLVQVERRSEQWANYLDYLINCEYPIGLLGWFFDYPDTSNYLEPFAWSETNYSIGNCYFNAHMDAMLAAASGETDASRRAELYQRAQVLYAEDVVTIPLFIESEYAVFNVDRISHISINPALMMDYTQIRINR
jgi:peptide/nickel transport system substrate-binding protein